MKTIIAIATATWLLSKIKENDIGAIVSDKCVGLTQCQDGTWSTLPSGRGVCNRHGGLATEYRKKKVKKAIPKANTIEVVEEITNGPHYIIDAKQKAELHLGRDFYKSLETDVKSEIKRYFSWSRGRKAWVSKGNYRNWGPQGIIEKLNLPRGGRKDRMTFEEQMQQTVDRAEYRAEKYAKRIDNSKQRQEGLQSEFRRLSKDWSWLTQPNVNTTGGRRFSNQRDKVVRRFEKGIEESFKRDHYHQQMETALQTASQSQLSNPTFLQRRIKDAKKEIAVNEKSIPNLERILSTPLEDRPQHIRNKNDEYFLDRMQDRIDDLQTAYEKLGFYTMKLNELIDSGVKVFDQESVKGAAYVKRRGQWYKVARVNKTTVSHSWHVGDWRSTYSEIEDVVFPEDIEQAIPLRHGNYQIVKKEKIGFISDSPFYFMKQRVGSNCRDKKYSSSRGRGTCSWHGGINGTVLYL